jgi:hypothetical protein
MKVSTIAYLGLSALLLGLMQTPAKGITIDEFSDVADDIAGEQSVTDTTQNNTAVTDINNNLTGVLGSQRTLSVTKTAPAGNNQGSKSVQLAVDPTPSIHEASYSSSANTTGNFAITWDGDFDGAGTNNYVDLTEGGTKDSFLVRVTTNDLGVTLNFDVTHANNTVAHYDIPLAAGTLGRRYFPFASFSNPSALQQAKKISLYSSDAPAELDFGFTFFSSEEEPVGVPFEFSPGLGMILGGGFLGLNTLRKKMKASNNLL